MAKLPETHLDDTIKYGVPYVYMDDDNDCWEAALLMLYRFIDRELDLSAIPSEARGVGIKPAELPDFLSKFLKPHDSVPASSLAYYQFLAQHGPALVVLDEIKGILHAQVLTGIRIKTHKSKVFLNNPDQDFAKADLSASGPFYQLERSIVERYGGISFADWEQTWSKAEEENDNNAAPTTLAYGSLNTSPVLSPRSSPQQSPVQSPSVSPQHSPTLPRSRSNSNSNSPSPERKSAHLAGPTLSNLDWSALKMQLTRAIPSNASAEKRRNYLADMERECMFRAHRKMDLNVFQAKLMRENGVPSLWTLRDW